MKQKSKKRWAQILAGLIAVVVAFAIGAVTAQEAYADETHSHNGITFEPWTNDSSLPQRAGNYYLTEDVTLSDTWHIPLGTVSLCLHGHSITMGSGESAIYIDNNRTLNLYNCKTAGTITHASDQTGSGVYINRGTFNMYGGTISGNEATFGGGIYVDSGTFNMSGGTISGNKATDGGGVFVFIGTFNMIGGTITENTASGAGGGIGVAAIGTIQLSGSPQITGNTANGKADNMYLGAAAKAKITGGLNTPEGTSGPQIGVGMYSPGVFTEGLSGKLPDGKTAKDLFFCDYSACIVTETDDHEAQLVSLVNMNGNGTVTSPYEITSYTDLNEFAAIVNGTHPNAPQDTAACGKLMDNITCDDKMWVPIGTQLNPYIGCFDGNNKVIEGLSNEDRTGVSNAENQGLFGYIGKQSNTVKGEVKNVGLEGGTIIGKKNVGGVAGWNLHGMITKCYNSGAVSGNAEAGGVAGENLGTITNCYNSGAVSGGTAVGGVAGLNYGGTITNCYNSGAVSGSSYVGGVAGTNYGGEITNCYYDTTFSKDLTAIGREEDTGNVKGLTTSQMTGGTALADSNMLFSYGEGEENPWIVKANDEDTVSGAYCCYYPHLKGFNRGSNNQQMDAADIAAADWPAKVVFGIVWKEQSSYTYEASPNGPEVTRVTVSQKPLTVPEGATSITYYKKSETGSWDPCESDDFSAPGSYKMTIKKGDKVIDEIEFIVLEPADYTVKYYQQIGTDNETGKPIWSAETVLPVDVGTYKAVVTVTRAGGIVLPEKVFQITQAEPIITTRPTASAITEGQSLGESRFSGGLAKAGDTEVPGTFAWTNSTVKPKASDSGKTEYEVTFTPNDTKNYKTATTEITLTVNSSESPVTSTSIDNATVVLDDAPLVYTGQPVTPVIRTIGGRKLQEGRDYTIRYTQGDTLIEAPTDAGIYTMTITGKGNFAGSTSTEFTIGKADGTLTASGNKVKTKSKTVKLKKVKKISAEKAYTIEGVIGDLAFSKVKADKASKKFKVNAKSGQIKVKKGLKNGKYKLTVLISDPGDKNHEAAEAEAIVTIRIRK